jgi:Cu(I)/Ag(I) efflux system membrane fusion protein
VRAFGTLEIAEPNKSVISARFNGRIEQLHVNAVGTTVNVGDPLFTLYSPDLIQAETEFLQALRDQSPSASNNRSTGRAKLLLLGLTDDQIRDLESKETAPLLVTYRSPARGVVVEKNIAVGAYVSEGATLYEIADLSMLWNVAEIYESDARHIKVGDRAKVAISTYPGESFSATVSLIYPVVNPQTRTVKVRLRIDNSSGKLRPNMFTETIFTRKMARSLAIPVNTVLVTGKRNLVYVKADHENHFEAREVGLGTRFDGKYEILWGLQEGEIVVSQGGYLIDSESQLRSGSGASHQHGVSAPTDTPKEEPDQHIH